MIIKEEAVKILNTVLLFGKCDCPMEEIEECLRMAIKALKQEPKIGHWIRQKGILGEETNTYECSLCGRTIYCYEEDELEDYPFCHCGAKMVKPQESEEE